jgi:CheY-like chemotaxis protein
MSRPVRILVVDDNIDQVQTMALLLHEMGHEVRFAINGESALSEARGFMPNVVFVDLGLPDIEGQDLCRQHAANRHFVTRGSSQSLGQADKKIGRVLSPRAVSAS